MPLIQIIILAIIQGATEFIPVSSSGHLVLARELFNWSDNGGLVLDTILHSAGLAAILFYYRTDFLRIILAYKNFNDKKTAYERKIPLLLIAATIPVAISAPFIKDALETVFRSATYVGATMIATAIWFFCCEAFAKQNKDKFGFHGALFAGIMQVIALLPGASRSGWTAGAGLISGHTRNASIKFAFYMAIPAIAGAVIFQINDIYKAQSLGFSWLNITIGFIVCFITSLGAIHFCVKFFSRHSFKIFAIYMAIAGALTLTLSLCR